MRAQWGRKETIVWPPHAPIYIFSAITLGMMFTGMLLWCRFTFGVTPLERWYMPAYLRSAVGSKFSKQSKYRLLYAGDGRREARLVNAEDVIEGETPTQEGRSLPFELSPDAKMQHLRVLFRAPERTYSDASMHTYLAISIYKGESLVDLYSTPMLFGAGAFLLGLPLAISKDVRRRKTMKYGRLLKGPIMCTPKEFNERVCGDGIGILTADAQVLLRIPRRHEAHHVEIIGDTGTGKTTLILQLLRQIQDREESAIVYDPACEFVRRFYSKERGDVILNPLDDRCPYWGPSEELRRKAEAQTLAASLYQPTNDKKGEFFTETPQQIFAHLLTFGPSPEELVHWLSDPSEIDKRVEGTEMASMIAVGAQQQRSGVLASLGLVAKSLRMLPTKQQANGRTWSATEWAEKRKGWIFITSKAAEREALRPLHSLWIDLLVLRLLNTPEPNQTPAWFVLDELASLQRLPQLHTAITENRKSKNPLVLGFQGKAQLETIYGHMAEVMLSQPATKIFLRTTEPKAAEWVSNAIGKVEIERVKETHSDGSRGHKTFALDRQIEPLVMDSEVSGLEDRHAFLKLGNSVARFSFDYLEMSTPTAAFIPRQVENDELSFDPKTLKPKARPTDPPSVLTPAAMLLPEDEDFASKETQVTIPSTVRARSAPGVALEGGHPGPQGHTVSTSTPGHKTNSDCKSGGEVVPQASPCDKVDQLALPLKPIVGGSAEL